MHVGSRGRCDNPLALVRRAASAAVVAAVLAGAVLVPSASAGSSQDVLAVIQDFASDGDITSCKFSKAQLEYVRGQITPDIDSYAPDFRSEIGNEIARWNNGSCSSSGGGGQSSYRATIKSLKVAKNRRSVKVKVKCPTTATASCKVKLSGKVGGKSAAKKKSATIKRGKSKNVKVKLTKATGQKLSKNGGKLKMSAKTVGSSLAASSRSITVAAG